MSLVETLQKFGWAGKAFFLSPSVLVVVNALVSEDLGGWHQEFVEVACLGVVPLGLVKVLIAHINLIVNVCEVLEMCIGSEVVTHKYFSLFWSGPVGAW